MAHLGEKIREARERRGIKRSVLARSLNVSWQAVKKMEESATMQADRLLQIAEIMNAPLSDFLGPRVRELEEIAANPRLPADEAELLGWYRRIPPDERKKAIGMLIGFAGAGAASGAASDVAPPFPAGQEAMKARGR